MGSDQKTVEVTISETGEIFTLRTGSLVASLRDILLGRRRMDIQATTWDKLSQKKQEEEIAGFESFAQDLINALVSAIATGHFPVIHAQLDNFKVKDGAVTLTAKGIASDEALVQLNHIGKKALKIVVSDHEQFDKDRPEAKADPDQPDMLEDDDEIEDDDGEDPSEWDKTAQDAVKSFSDGFKEAIDADIAKDQPEAEEEAEEDQSIDEPEPEPEPEPEISQAKADTAAVSDPEAVTVNEYQEGIDARSADQGKDFCPYDGGTLPHEQWVKGWNSANDEAVVLKQQGYIARKNGVGPNRCPWKKGSAPYKFWMVGYDAAKKEEEE